VGFSSHHFKVASGLIENIGEIGFERTFQASLTLRTRLLSDCDCASKERRFGLVFVDGVSNCEELFIAAVRTVFMISL